MIITRLWSEQPGKYFCLSTKSATGKWRDHFFTRTELSKVPAFIKDNSDKDIYFCPHGFTRPQRQKAHAVIPSLLWSDLDEADPRTIKIKPTVAIESSPNRFVGLWLIDGPMNESLNRRLSHVIGGDKSGWDLTQVLRVPGTYNYKYNHHPRVRTLWTDGPEYSIKQIEAKLPREKNSETTSVDASEASDLYKKYEKKLPQWLRRELLSGKPTPGKRSEVLWKISQTLIEKGVSSDEALVLLKASPWNKFRGRRNEDEQLRREIDKGVNSRFRPSIVGEEDDEEELAFRSMDQVEEENIDWIYYPYIARGELSIVEGDPGLGKSYMMQIISAAVADGKTLPSVKKMKPIQGKIIYFDIENSAGSVTKKRLLTNGLKNLKNFIQCEEPFSIDDDDFMEKVYDYMERVRPVLVVFDTLNTYLGKADAYKGHEAQQAFVRFRELASRFNCSVVVLRHLTKSSRERALYRGQGSISLSGLARVVVTVGCVPDDPDTRAMAVTKINVAKPPPALSFHIRPLPDTLKDQDRSEFVWGEFLELTSEDLVSAPEKSEGNEREEVREFLLDILDGGEMEVSKIERMAESRSINDRRMRRAAEDLGIIKRRDGFGKGSRVYWRLKDDDGEE